MSTVLRINRGDVPWTDRQTGRDWTVCLSGLRPTRKNVLGECKTLRGEQNNLHFVSNESTYLC